jgi:uncharacterized protein (DUF58 family)
MPVLYMILGAALCALGVVASAYADRIRQLRVSREIPSRAKIAREVSAPAPIQVIEPAPKTRKEPKVIEPSEDADDVIAALVAAKYKKPVAAEAVWACTPAERATVETWTAAALRRCMRGGLS